MPFWFTWTLLMVYSQARQTVAVNHFLFQTILNRKHGRQIFDCQALLCVSFRHIFISLTSFMGIPNSIWVLYSTSLLTESYAFLKCIKGWWTASLYSHFFSSIWRLQNIWLVVNLLCKNLHWWSPVIYCGYGAKLDSKMFG